MRKKVTYEIEGGFEVEFDNSEDEPGINVNATYTQETMWYPLDIWEEIVAAASNLIQESGDDE